MLGAVIATSFSAGMYCLYYGYHPVLQPFPLGVTFLTGNVTGHSIVSKPSMQCVQYDSRCNSVCGVSGSDCEHARCDAFCVTRELGIGFTCAVNIYPDHILYAMSVQDMRTARTRKSALDLCASLFPLKSTFKMYTVASYAAAPQLENEGGFLKPVWLGYGLFAAAGGLAVFRQSRKASRLCFFGKPLGCVKIE